MEDKCLDKIKQLKRVKIKNPEFLNADFSNIADFKDRLFLFDDIDCMTDKRILRKVYELMDLILQTGRKYNVTMIHTSHNACAGAYTKLILNEAHSTTFFINGMSNVAMKYLCNSYLGLSLNQIDMLKKMKTRWVTVFKTCPEILMTQKMMVFTNDLGSESKPISGGQTDVMKTVIVDDSNVSDEKEEQITVKAIKKYKCECGAMTRIDNKKRHESTPRHKNSIM
jgi:hypothetical protein